MSSVKEMAIGVLLFSLKLFIFFIIPLKFFEVHDK